MGRGETTRKRKTKSKGLNKKQRKGGKEEGGNSMNEDLGKGGGKSKAHLEGGAKTRYLLAKGGN